MAQARYGGNVEGEKKSRGDIDSTIDEVPPYGEEPVEILIDDDVL